MFVWRKFIDDSGQEGVNCAVFRNEAPHRYQSSELVRQADAIADFCWPGERHYTYVNPKAIRSTNPGYCFVAAGWRKSGMTKSGLLIFDRAALEAALQSQAAEIERLKEQSEQRLGALQRRNSDYRNLECNFDNKVRRITELEAERHEALQLTESCSTLKEMATACIEGATMKAATERLRADLHGMQDGSLLRDLRAENARLQAGFKDRPAEQPESNAELPTAEDVRGILKPAAEPREPNQ